MTSIYVSMYLCIYVLILTISLAMIQGAYAASITVTIPSNSSVPGCERTNNCYTPSAGTVLVGDRVTWINNDSVAHTVTSGNPSKGPDGLFDSGLFTTGKSFSYQFTSIGRYDYFCAVHPWMTGYITVGLPANTTIFNGTFTRVLQYPPVAVILPIPQAYEDATIILDGSKSYDLDNSPKPLSYQWSQIGGMSVSIQNPNSAIASFIAPQVNATEVLTFMLTVYDGLFTNSTSTTSTINDATCYGTQLSFDKSTYPAGSDFIMTIDSKNANIDPNVVDTIPVSIILNNTSQTVIAYETGVNTGVFTFSSSVDKFVLGPQYSRQKFWTFATILLFLDLFQLKTPLSIPILFL